MANEIKLTFAGDDKSLTRSFDNVGRGAKEMAGDLDQAGGKAKGFGSAIGGMNDRVDASEGKLMGTADLLDGLGGAFGLPLSGATDMARAFGDMAGGFATVVGPALEKVAIKFGIMTAAEGGATGATWSLNTALKANPILSIVALLTLLVGGFVLAYKKSETFRNIVNGTWAAIRTGAEDLWKYISGFFRKLGDAAMDSARVIGKVADIITTPYQIAFRAIASLWNNTVGRLHVSIPGFMGFGGVSFDVPDIPMLAKGGIAHAGMPAIVGERGPELFVPNRTGTVIPNGGAGTGGGGSTVVIPARSSAESILETLRGEIRRKGGNVQVVLGVS